MIKIGLSPAQYLKYNQMKKNRKDMTLQIKKDMISLDRKSLIDNSVMVEVSKELKDEIKKGDKKSYKIPIKFAVDAAAAAPADDNDELDGGAVPIMAAVSGVAEVGSFISDTFGDNEKVDSIFDARLKYLRGQGVSEEEMKDDAFIKGAVEAMQKVKADKNSDGSMTGNGNAWDDFWMGWAYGMDVRNWPKIVEMIGAEIAGKQ